jgi:nucleoside-diphosphate-sugar epimerase
MELHRKLALVTGAAGTVGSVVARRLSAEQMRVRAMVRRPGALANGESAEEFVAELSDRLRIRESLDEVGLVVHCAAAATDDLAECLRTNTEGTRNVVDAAADAGCELLVHISTVSVYDYRKGTLFTEESPLWTEALDPYGYSKAEAERIVRSAADGGLKSVVLRPVVVLSTHAKSHWGPLAIERARAFPGPVLPVAEVPYVHVDNLAEAVILAARRPIAVGRSYNVIDGIGDAGDFLTVVYGVLGRSPPRLAEDAPRLRYSGERIQRELGYAPVDRWKEFLGAMSRLRV